MRKILAQNFRIFPHFFTIKTPKFSLIFHSYVYSFWLNSQSYISLFFISTLTKNSPSYTNQIPTQFLFLYSSHFLSVSLSHQKITSIKILCLKKTLIWSSKIANKNTIYIITKFLSHHLSSFLSKNSTPTEGFINHTPQYVLIKTPETYTNYFIRNRAKSGTL